MESVHLKDKENCPSLRPGWLFSMDRSEKQEVPSVPKKKKRAQQEKTHVIRPSYLACVRSYP